MRCRLQRGVGLLFFVTLVLLPGRALSADAPKIAPNHMRWENHDAVLSNAVAWQEEREGHWVTVVLLTDIPVPAASRAPRKSPGDMMEEAKAQGIALAVMSGGLPPPRASFEVAFHDGADTKGSGINGAGGFEIESQSATRIKGRTVLDAETGSSSGSGWSVSFDAPVLGGDAKRMAVEGEPLGDGAGQPGKDLLAVQKAQRAMDYATLSAYASPKMAKFLQDPALRPKNLTMLKAMTPPQARMLGGLRKGDEARVVWAQEWPGGGRAHCVETMTLKDGKWRSTESDCQHE